MVIALIKMRGALEVCTYYYEAKKAFLKSLNFKNFKCKKSKVEKESWHDTCKKLHERHFIVTLTRTYFIKKGCFIYDTIRKMDP